MPVSDYHGVSDIMGEIQRLHPKSVLDLGVGFGLYGVVCRQILDAQHGRCAEDDWEALLIGWEVFNDYNNPCWDVYDMVNIGDFTKHPQKEFDLVLMIDSLEHIKPERGRPFLAELVKRNKHVIVSVPNGRMHQGEVHGNPHEAHLWTFTELEEFAGYKYKVLHRGVCTVVSIEGGA